MTTTLGLLLFGATLGALGPRGLERASWTTRSPVLGILAWQAVTVGVFVSFIWAGVTLAAHAMPDTGWVGRAVHACSALLPEEGAAKQSPWLPALGATLSVGLVLALLFVAYAGWRRTLGQVRRQNDLLDVVSDPHAESDVVVLDHQVPTVFCLPGGREQRVVVSTGALRVLTASQLEQVLAHERAHLQSRHHLVLRWADAFSAVLGGHFGTRTARRRIAELVEMHADDAASPAKRRDLAEALVALAGCPHPIGALGAGGSALSRVHRLVTPVSPVSPLARGGIVLTLGAVVVTPIIIALAPGLAALFVEACPFFL